MPVAKKQKVAASRVASSSSIAAFTRVSKAHSISKSTFEKVASLETSFPAQLGDKKRKLELVEEIVVDNTDDYGSTLLPASVDLSQRDIKPLPVKRPRQSQPSPQTSPQTPARSHFTSRPLTPADTPTKGKRTLVERLFLPNSSPAAPPSSLYSNSSRIIQGETSENRSAVHEEVLGKEKDNPPAEFFDLVNLNSAFLTALSLHYAHNGIHSPADLRLLCPDVARAWGKRKVVLVDIRRTLSILNRISTNDSANKIASTSLTLSDYGHGKICIEMKTLDGRAGRIARPLDESCMNAVFAQNLQNMWEDRENMGMSSFGAFVDSLVLEPITTCSSLVKMSPLLAKGQRRLEDLKAGIIIKKEAEKTKSSATKEELGPRPTLLQRLRAKQLQQANLPPPPSKEELARKAALHRLEEVVAVLSLLTTSTSIGQQRVSFTMPTVLGKLRDSFKTPMSKEEGENCVKLLASEIAPEWLKIVRMGKVDAIVVSRDNRPSELDIRNRIKCAA